MQLAGFHSKGISVGTYVGVENRIIIVDLSAVVARLHNFVVARVDSNRKNKNMIRQNSLAVRLPHQCYRLLLLMCVLSVSVTGAVCFGGESLKSGRDIGEKVPSFYVRAVTGPLRNQSTCYVCRNGNRPVAMVLLRKMEPELQPLLEKLDEIVDSHRAEGLRSFCVYLSDQPRSAIPVVQTFAFDHQIATPMTVASETIAAPTHQNIHPHAAVTVVLYEHQQVVNRFAFRAGELTKDNVQAVLVAVRELVPSHE